MRGSRVVFGPEGAPGWAALGRFGRAERFGQSGRFGLVGYSGAGAGWALTWVESAGEVPLPAAGVGLQPLPFVRLKSAEVPGAGVYVVGYS